MKQTTPLAKAYTTTEGILAIVFNAVLAAAATIPTHALNPKYAAVMAGVVNVALIGQRGLIKVKALASSPEGSAILNNSDPISIVLQDIEASAQAVQLAQSQPGTPPDKVTVGLSPTPETPQATTTGV